MPGTLAADLAIRQPATEKRPMSSTNTHLRLSRDAWTRYSADARARGVALGTYLRQRLEEQDRLIAELAIRAASEQDATTPDRPATDGLSTDSGTLVEVLLLLRSIVGPQKSAMVHREVERLGLSSWS
jgi:hypothetical protein